MTKPAEGYKVCTLNDLPVQGGRLVKINGKDIALFRTSDDHVYALENICPHKQGPLVEGIITGDILICPLHAQKINLIDGVVQAPDEGCAVTYEVNLKGKEVYINL